MYGIVRVNVYMLLSICVYVYVQMIDFVEFDRISINHFYMYLIIIDRIRIC